MHGNILWQGVELLTQTAAHSHVELKEKIKFLLLWVGGQAVGLGETMLGVMARSSFVCFFVCSFLAALLFFYDGTNSSEEHVGTSGRKKDNTDTSCLTLAGSRALTHLSEGADPPSHGACDDVTAEVQPPASL